MALWNLVYSRTSDLQDDPGLQRGFKSIYARFSENYLKENGENTLSSFLVLTFVFCA